LAASRKIPNRKFLKYFDTFQQKIEKGTLVKVRPLVFIFEKEVFSNYAASHHIFVQLFFSSGDYFLPIISMQLSLLPGAYSSPISLLNSM
jgi:hypothetical protein